jgi:DNA-binding response OmpR family regulator
VIRVLHIEPEASIRLLVRPHLEAEGMEVIEAADGQTGLQFAKHEQPHMILLDVMLPVLDGWQVAEELRKDQATHEVLIVFLTARAELKDRVRGFDLGAVDYIFKPFDPRELPNASAACWYGSSAASGASCGARRSPSCARAWTRKNAELA